jgi:hypothetical protein
LEKGKNSRRKGHLAVSASSAVRPGLAWLLSAAILLATPLATAVGVQGTVSVSSLSLSAGHVTLSPAAAWFPTDGSDLALSAASGSGLHVEFYEENFTEATALNISAASPRVVPPGFHEFDVVDGTVTMAPGVKGGVGFYPGTRGLAQVDATSANLEARSSSLVGDSHTAQPGEDRGFMDYGVQVSYPHVALTSVGLFTYEGDGGVKIYGPTLIVHSAHGDTVIETGSRGRPSAGAGVETRRWVFVTFSHASWELQALHPFNVLAPTADARWQGSVDLVEPSGQLHGGSDVYGAATGATQALLSGDFSAHIVPSADSTPRLAMTLSGDMDATTLQAAHVSALPERTATLTFALGAATVVAAGAVGYGIHRKVRSRYDELDPDELSSLANLAAEGGRFAEALHWTDAALRQAPGSARLHEDRAFFLAETGEVDLAIEAYFRAGELAKRGDPYLAAAVLMFDTGRASSEVLPVLARALERSPSLWRDVEERFEALRGFPELRAMVIQARRRER